MKRTPVLATLLILAAALACGERRDPSEVLGPASSEVPARTGPTDDLSNARPGSGATASVLVQGAGFFFLPPLGDDGASGPFAADLSPTVVVCRWTGGRCEDGSTLARFSRAGGTGGATIRVSTSDEHYRVNWDTGETLAAPESGETYQIVVRVGGAVLGTADIRIEANGSGGKGSGAAYTIVRGRTLPLKFRIELGALPSLFGVDCPDPAGCFAATFTAEGGVPITAAMPSGRSGFRVDGAHVRMPQGATELTLVIVEKPLVDGVCEAGYAGAQRGGCSLFETLPAGVTFLDDLGQPAGILGVCPDAGVGPGYRLAKHEDGVTTFPEPVAAEFLACDGVPAELPGAGGLVAGFSTGFWAAPESGAGVSGTVYYSTTPLEGVTVELVQGGPLAPPTHGTTTGADGSYAFAAVEPGTYWVKAYGGGEFVEWVATEVTVGSSGVVQDVDLPKAIGLVSPGNGEAVGSYQPTLTWMENAEAVRYVVQLNVADPWTLVEQEESAGAAYTVQTPLSLGETYTWQVDAYDADGRHVGTTPHAFTFTVAFGASGTAVVDGVASPGEWDEAYCVGLTTAEGVRKADLCLMNDATDLYLSLHYSEAPSQPVTTWYVLLDRNGNGRAETGDPGDEGLTMSTAPGTFADHISVPTEPCPPGVACSEFGQDTRYGGTADGAGAFGHDGGRFVLEMSHPLDSADDAHDISVAAGDLLGLSTVFGDWWGIDGERLYLPFAIR